MPDSPVSPAHLDPAFDSFPESPSSLVLPSSAPTPEVEVVWALRMPMTVCGMKVSARHGAWAVLPLLDRQSRYKYATVPASHVPLMPSVGLRDGLPHSWTITDVWPLIGGSLPEASKIFVGRSCIWKQHPETRCWAAFCYEAGTCPYTDHIFVKQLHRG